MSSGTTRAVIALAVCALVLWAAPQALCVDRTVKYTGDIWDIFPPTTLAADVQASDGAVSQVPVNFSLKNLFKSTRKYGPALTNGSGDAGLLASIPSDVWAVKTTAKFNGNTVDAPEVVLTVIPRTPPRGATSGVAAAGVLKVDDDQRARCDADREITFGLLLFRGPRPFSYTPRFMLIDPNGPIWPTCQLDPVCQPVRVEVTLVERVIIDCECVRNGAGWPEVEEDCEVTLIGKATINGARGYPFTLTVRRDGDDFLLDFKAINHKDVNFQRYYEVHLVGDIDDLFFSVICPPPTLGACCDGETCTQTTEGECTGTWQEGVACDPNPCVPPPPTGSCCVGAVCSQTTQANCTGKWQEGVSCSPNPCAPQPLGACCVNGNCKQSTQANCTGQWTQGLSCDPNPCTAPPPLNCSNIAPLSLGWPPNNMMDAVPISILDCNGEPATITIDYVSQNEVTQNNPGDACPDAAIVGGVLYVRHQRIGSAGTDTDRIYVVEFTAVGCTGQRCSGTMTVCVPHDQNNPPCANVVTRQTYDSFGGCSD